MGSAAASVIAVGGGVTACPAAGRGGTGGSDGALPVHTLRFQAELSGADKAHGVAQERGARLAVEHHESKPSPKHVCLKQQRGR